MKGFSFQVILAITLLFTSQVLIHCASFGAADQVASSDMTLDNYLDSGTDEENLQCLMRVLAKVNKDTKIDQKAINGAFQEDIHEGVTQGIDVATMLLQFTHLQKEDRDAISVCDLDLSQAIQRCEDVYVVDGCAKVSIRKATGIKEDPDTKFLPYVTRSCPAGYIRLGCCKCVRACEEYKDIFDAVNMGPEKDVYNYCMKKPTYASAIEKFISNADIDKYEPYGDRYVEKCIRGFSRVGARLCVPKCPLGWPDHGDRCIKAGEVVLMPFAWAPGDQPAKRGRRLSRFLPAALGAN
jgi:hypothetical protein